MKKVSIIIPIYNAAKYLTATLDSILSQSYKDWTCVLVNDGSTDNSLAICEQYMAKDSRFVVFTKPNEKSADMARAYGIERVKTAWIMYLDADDVLEPTYIENMIARQQETGADVVSPTMVYCEHELEGEIWRLPCAPIVYDDVLSGKEACVHTINGWCLTTNGMLYRTELNDGIVRGHYMNSDEFSSRQILFKAGKVAFSRAMYIYRQYGESSSRKVSPRLFERWIVDKHIEDFVFEHYEDNKEVERAAVCARFFNMLYLLYILWKQKSLMQSAQYQWLMMGGGFAYNTLNKKRLQKYLPKHFMLFMHGYGWFKLMAIAYHKLRELRGLAPYEVK